MTTAPTTGPLPPFARPGRRRLVLALRLLPAVVLLVVGPLAWIVWRRAQPHLGAAAYLTTLGAQVQWHWDSEGWRRGIYTTVQFDRNRTLGDFKDDDMAHLAKLHRLEVLELANCYQLTDAGLKVLAGLRDLRELRLGQVVYQGYDPKVGDAGLVHLAGLTRLEILELQGTGLTDRGLANLSGLTRLQDLSLGDTRITDAGLKHLKGLSQLQELDLRDTAVTDAGLTALTGLSRLRTVRLEGTRVTPRGVALLQQALPEAEISVGPSPRR
jgi:hypothetical protein